MRIINARVVPMDAPAIENGYVDFQDGRIVNVGEVPANATDDESLDAHGGWLLPGFVDAHSHLGMWEDALGFEGDDGNEDTDPSLRICAQSTPLIRSIVVFRRRWRQVLRPW